MDNPSLTDSETNTNADAGKSNASNAAPDAVAPVVQSLFKRAVSGAHQAVDGAAAKVAPVVDTISNAKDTKDEWIGAARDAIREHPFAAIATALLIGAAYHSLTSSRER